MKRPAAELGRMAVTYCRVSSKEQEKEGFSIPAQEKLLRAYAAENGLAIQREFVDVETAKKTGRTNFDEMIRFFKKNSRCRVLLVEKTDRLYRNFRDYVTIDELDLEVHLVKENTIVSRDSRSSEKFVHGIKVLMAKNYIDNLSEETRKGMNEKAEQGIFPSRCPLGYRNVTEPDGKKKIEVDPEYAPLVKQLFEWYSSGQYSLHQVARMAHEAGFVYRRSRKPVSRATIHIILKNRIYTGMFDWKGKTYQGKHDALISHELWEKVQRLLRERNQRKTRIVRHDFPFARLIRCGHCGCALVGEIKKKRYVYYHCTGFKQKCPEPFVREELLAECFTEILRGLVLDQEVIDLVTLALRQSHRDARQFHEESTARLQAESTKLQNRIDAMYTDKLDGIVDLAFFERKSAEWRTEQMALLRQITQHQQANQTYLHEGIQLLQLAQQAADLFARQESKEQRRLLDFVLSNCTWADGKLTVQFRQPFDLLAVTNEALRKEKAAGSDSSGPRQERLPE
jgi:site-specific DNA recombinase